MQQKGQALIILLLIMLVALTIGLAITQRSITDLASSNKVDQSSRAFSAAEAGIEKAIQLGASTTVSSTDLGNQTNASVKSSGPLPRPGQALEYPPIGKDTIAQFWMVDPGTLAISYGSSIVNVFFGNTYSNPQDPDTPAVEINLITKNNAGNYISNRSYFDPISSRRISNNFLDCTTNFPGSINTTNSLDAATADRNFRCRIVISIPSGQIPIMIRSRVLYTNTSQPIAVQPASGSSLPLQATIYTSVGTSGITQRKIQVFKLQNVVPAYFDFSIFSSGDINK